jgi:ATP-dependent DNA ligase
MGYPIAPPVEPMLAKLAHEMPEGPFLFEPKWDGFRAMVFRDGEDIHIQSRDLKPLQRYFPELLGPLRASLPERCVVDGEIVIAKGGALDFEALLNRIHPAASRVEMLSREHPASFVAFDLLGLGDDDLRNAPQQARRAKLEAALASTKPPIHLTPMTRDRALAEDWFHRFEGAGLDGVVAKHEDLVYSPGKRTMIKVKHERTADCVVGGFRWFKGGKGTLVGSLMLGMYDADRVLHHVGICASFTRERRAELARELEPLRENAREGHPWAAWSAAKPEDTSSVRPGPGPSHPTRKPGAQSRWSHGKDLSWEPLRLERACEVAYDHMQGARFRHATHFRRWRPDKPLADCTYASLEVAAPFELAKIFGT